MGRKSRQKSSQATAAAPEPIALTFMGHVRELRRRLFWTALWFVILSGIVFPFYHDIIQILMRPLGDEKLYFLSPIGGLSFAMKICMYVGLIATLPILVYNLYKFISPAMPNHRARTAIGYVCLSAVLAVCGIAFAYLVSLPSALHFLTHFDIGNVSAMLTVDAYLSFIISYVLAGAILFQLPLLMVIIDNITPTPPSRWNKYQRHMIVAAFVIAMLITPVPDIINQVILAMPIIFMYQFGIFLVWMRHRKKKRAPAEVILEDVQRPEPEDTPEPALEPTPPLAPVPLAAAAEVEDSFTPTLPLSVTADMSRLDTSLEDAFIEAPLAETPAAVSEPMIVEAAAHAQIEEPIVVEVVQSVPEAQPTPVAAQSQPARRPRSVDGFTRRTAPEVKPVRTNLTIPGRTQPQISTIRPPQMPRTIDGFFPAR